MNKTVIKNFAIWARRKLISDITYKAGLLGINDKGISEPLPISTDNIQFFEIGTGKPTEIANDEIKQRKALVTRIKEKESTSDYKTAYQYVVEEVAYTWFNRLIAIRFMEVNDYLPSGVRVLSSRILGKSEPDIVTTPHDTDMEFSAYEQDRIIQLKDENKLDELFRMLFIKQCNKLNEVLPGLFEKTSDYTELLLNISFTDQEGVVNHLIKDIAEEDFMEAVEIIGWLYQYYITEKHEEVINVLGKKAIAKDDIPAATQIFTTDWVVKYMVDNSLGRYWIERNPKTKLIQKLEYFVSSNEEDIKYISEKILVKDLSFFDPCMGSGHILVYAFDVLMEIYKECGYLERDAAQEIVKNNLFGLDIDNRAYQLAYFAVMMKARSYDRRILSRNIEPNVFSLTETNTVDHFTLNGITNNPEYNEIGEYLARAFVSAKEIGSLLTIEINDYIGFESYLDNCEISGQVNFEITRWNDTILPLMKKVAKQAQIMSRKYTVVCTNPPYMNKMEGSLKKFIIDNYNPYKGDLFSVFMYRNFEYCKAEGYSAFMTPNVWMFIKTYTSLRKEIISTKGISTLVQMAKGAFFEEATVDVCAFVLKNGCNKFGDFIRLESFKGNMEVQKNKFLEAINNDKCNYKYKVDINKFLDIPGNPIAYWTSDSIYSDFELGVPLLDIAPPKQGMATTNNNRFLRLWFETNYSKIGFHLSSEQESIESKKKYFPYNKGGEFRRWYGNYNYVVNFENGGKEICNYIDKYSNSRVNHKGRVINREYYFKECITWSDTTSAAFSGRYVKGGSIFDIKGSSGFPNSENVFYILGLLNSKMSQEFIHILNPTITTQVGDLSRIPVIINESLKSRVDEIVLQNINISKEDWDSFESSWDFKKHPLLEGRSLKDAYKVWENQCNYRFNQLKINEEELNKIFIDIYGLKNELTPDVEDKAITVSKAKLDRDIKSLISYAVGCMFGRYSLDKEGIIYAGGDWDNDEYVSFIPDRDNCIPITDEEYFKDDIVGLFVKFIKKVYGQEYLEENLEFVATALGNNGNSPRETIRNYFVNKFFKDHCSSCSVTGSGKRPIYWLYDSGKQNGFKALIYMHRYTADTTGIVRVDYLHKMQKIYMGEINRMQDMIENSTHARDVAQAEKRKEKLIKQLKETKEYDEKIAHIALSRIDIDLDDGVKVNYEKAQTAQDGKKLDIFAKI